MLGEANGVGREGPGSAVQSGPGEGDEISRGAGLGCTAGSKGRGCNRLGLGGITGKDRPGGGRASCFDQQDEAGPSAPYGMDWPDTMYGGDGAGLYGGISRLDSPPRPIPLRRRERRM
jgi:hypothetical protein